MFRTTRANRRLPRPDLEAGTRGASQGLFVPGAAETICGLSRQTIFDWINERRVERLIDALRLSRASGVAIECLAGDDVEKARRPRSNTTPKAPAEEDLTRFSGALAHYVIRCAIGYPRGRRPVDAGDSSPKGKGALWGGAVLGLAPIRFRPAFAIVSRIARCRLQLLARILRASRSSAEPSRLVTRPSASARSAPLLRRPTAAARIPTTRQPARTRRNRGPAQRNPGAALPACAS